jgi:hypothetical protein
MGTFMKRVLVLACVLILANASFAATKTNASPTVVALENQRASRPIVFSAPVRDLVIRNQDATRYVWVDLTSATNGIGFAADTCDTARCTLLGPTYEIALYDFFTSGLTISGDNGVYGASGGASPISVEATF